MPADAAPLGPWGASRPLTELNGPNTDEFGPWLSDDRLELYFSSNLSGISRRLYRAPQLGDRSVRSAD
jgi:hypothetical protein